MHKISISILPQWYRPDADLDSIYGMLREAGIEGLDLLLLAEFLRSGPNYIKYEKGQKGKKSLHAILLLKIISPWQRS